MSTKREQAVTTAVATGLAVSAMVVLFLFGTIKFTHWFFGWTGPHGDGTAAAATMAVFVAIAAGLVSGLARFEP